MLEITNSLDCRDIPSPAILVGFHVAARRMNEEATGPGSSSYKQRDKLDSRLYTSNGVMKMRDCCLPQLHTALYQASTLLRGISLADATYTARSRIIGLEFESQLQPCDSYLPISIVGQTIFCIADYLHTLVLVA